jgi:hypothetical protein
VLLATLQTSAMEKKKLKKKGKKGNGSYKVTKTPQWWLHWKS